MELVGCFWKQLRHWRKLNTECNQRASLITLMHKAILKTTELIKMKAEKEIQRNIVLGGQTESNMKDEKLKIGQIMNYITCN